MATPLLEWHRDSKGYKTVPGRPPDPNSRTVFGSESQSMRIVPSGGDPIAYRPKLDRLFFKFAQVDTPTQLLLFVRRYGLLSRAWKERHAGDNVELTLDAARQMKWLLDNGSEWRPTEPVYVARLEAWLSAEGLQIKPATLLGGLWMHAGLGVQRGSRLRQCSLPACGKLFEAGPNSRPLRRGDATYCCKEHQEHHKSLRRSIP